MRRFLSQRFSLAAAATIAVLGVAVYWPTLGADPIFDDLSSVTQNRSIRSLWPLGPVLMPPSECTVAGRPLVNLTFALNYAWGGLGVTGYRVVNLCFHVGAAWLLFGALRRVLGRLNIPEGDRVAWVVAALWTVHPLLTATVAYISQRTEIMAAFFYLLAFYGFIRWQEETDRKWQVVSVAACFLGVSSKEIVVTAPVLLLLFDRTFYAGSFREAWRRRWRYYLAVTSSWILLAGLMTGLRDRAVGFGLGVSWWEYALTECEAVLRYAGLVLWPSPLIFDYGAVFASGGGIAWALAVVAVSLIVLAVRAVFRWPRAGFLGAAFFLLLAPTSSFVPVSAQPIAENRAYLPSAMVLGLAVLALTRVLRRAGAKFTLAIGVTLVALSLSRGMVLRDRLSLWQDTAAKRPQNPRVHANLGEFFHERKQLERAKGHFQDALRLKPNYFEAHNNLGTILFELGDRSGAEFHFREALRLRPEYATAHSNLCNFLFQTGRLEEARVHGEEAIRLLTLPQSLQIELAEAHNNLANVYLLGNEPERARQHYMAALERKPDFARARMNLGVVFRLQGKLEDAERELKLALDREPNLPEALFNFGLVLAARGRPDEAIVQFAAAAAKRPEFVEAHVGLGQLLAQKGDLVAARTHFEAALRLRPDDGATRSNLERVLAAIGSNSPTSQSSK